MKIRTSLLYKTLLLVSAILIVRYSAAQQSYAYKSTLGDVKEPGFYKINLPPVIVAKCLEGLRDVRIFDNKAMQVPYIVRSEPLEFKENSFFELPVISKKKEADKQTHVVIENTINKTISELLLIIKNTDAERTVTISGSDDNKQWYVIKENILLNNFLDPGNDRFIQSLGFPASYYKYFKIIINGKDVLPVNIVKAGIYETVFYNGKYVEVPSPILVQKDSTNNTSYITLRFNDEYQIDKLEATIKGVKYYRRNMAILKSTGYSALEIANHTLRSDKAASYLVTAKAKELIFAISNEDNPVLKITSVKAYQLNKYLLTYLEPGINYQLMFGNPTATLPRYDLEFLKDSVKNNASEMATGPVLKNDAAVADTQSKKNTVVLWIIIGLVLILLLALTLRMTKEMGNRENR